MDYVPGEKVLCLGGLVSASGSAKIVVVNHQDSFRVVSVEAWENI